MKKLILGLSVTLFLSSFAQAQEFEPSVCGQDQTANLAYRNYSVDSICIGFVRGIAAVEVKYTQKSKKRVETLQVIKIEDVDSTHGTFTLTNKKGKQVTANVTSRDGEFEYISGVTPQGIKYNSTNLEEVE